MIGAGLVEKLVRRCYAEFLLGEFLEAALRILPETLRHYVVSFVEQLTCNEILRVFVASIKIDGSDQSLERIRKDYLSRAARVLGLPSREEEIFIHAELCRSVRDAHRIYKRRTIGCEISFRFVWIFCKKKFRDDKFQDSIAQEFEALVVLAPRFAIFIYIRAMRERLLEPFLIAKSVSNLRFECSKFHVFLFPRFLGKDVYRPRYVPYDVIVK